MKEETKKFLFGGFLAGVAAFLSTMLPYFEKAAESNPQLTIAVALISGLLNAINVFSNRFETIRKTKSKVRTKLHL